MPDPPTYDWKDAEPSVVNVVVGEQHTLCRRCDSPLPIKFSTDADGVTTFEAPECSTCREDVEACE